MYWSSIFILPASITSRIKSTLSAFLWRGSSLRASGAKVAWDDICHPTLEGGLGIKKLAMWNQAATLKHLWRVITDSSSLWTSWVPNNILKGRSIWSINVPSNPSPTWRKILQCRELCRGLITTRIGDSAAPSLWYDYLLPQGQRICDLLSHRIMATSGLGWNAKVSNIINGSNWAFPPGHQNLSSI